MNKIKMALLVCSLLSFLAAFTSCNEQNRSKNNTGDALIIGVSVSQINKTIWAIYQDKKSNYWFGSKENGVFYYNGRQIKHITAKDGLVSNEVRGFQEDSLGNIYIETVQGISKFDGHSFVTLAIKEVDSLTNNWQLKLSDLWFRMDFNNMGVYRYDGEFLHVLKFPKSPQEDKFNSKNRHANLRPYGLYTIYKDRKGVMWFGTANLGVCRYDGRTMSWHYEEQLQTTPNGGDFGIRAIFEDKEGKFWINNSHFRYNIKPSNGDVINFQKEEGIGYLFENKELEFPFFLSITEDNEGNLWMVTYDNGVWKYDGKELIHYPIKDGKTNVLLFTIYKDNKGVLWLGSDNAGVFRFNGKTFEKQF